MLKLRKKLLRAAAAGKGEFDKEYILEGRERGVADEEFGASFESGEKCSEVSGDGCTTQ